MRQSLITAQRPARLKYAHSLVNNGANACRSDQKGGFDSALTGFEPPMRFVDDVNAALAAHDAVIAMATTQRFQGITDFHS
jgi:hypothetical protein